jgi:16S rRNA (cytosine1402-N4)-methyltransferase
MTAKPTKTPHIPVLLAEVLETLAVAPGGRYFDATFGAGGYTSAILEVTDDVRVQAIDRDPTAVKAGFPVALAYDGRLQLGLATFEHMDLWTREQDDGSHGLSGTFDGVVFDLGLSSMQIDRPERGFSFQADGPLDMRMSSENGKGLWLGVSAADIVNTYDEAAIASILFHYGEERRSRAIAKAIVARRKETPFERTLELAELVERVIGRKPGDPKHPATRTFQALRIAANDEFGQIVSGLVGAERLLKPGGRLVVVTFHSIEDRIVKRFLAERSGKTDGGSRHLPQKAQLQRPSFQLVNQRPLTPNEAELRANPRARSAKLRAATRLDAPAWPVDARKLGVPTVET